MKPVIFFPLLAIFAIAFVVSTSRLLHRYDGHRAEDRREGRHCAPRPPRKPLFRTRARLLAHRYDESVLHWVYALHHPGWNALSLRRQITVLGALIDRAAPALAPAGAYMSAPLPGSPARETPVPGSEPQTGGRTQTASEATGQGPATEASGVWADRNAGRFDSALGGPANGHALGGAAGPPTLAPRACTCGPGPEGQHQWYCGWEPPWRVTEEDLGPGPAAIERDLAERYPAEDERLANTAERDAIDAGPDWDLPWTSEPEPAVTHEAAPATEEDVRAEPLPSLPEDADDPGPLYSDDNTIWRGLKALTAGETA